MKTKIYVLSLFCIAFFTSLNAQNTGYRIARTFQLSGNGWWDYLSVDTVNSRLFVSHGSQVNVVDLKSGKELAIIRNTNGVHGIAIANDLNRAFISCGADSSILIVDLKTFNPVIRLKVTGRNPDAILYDQFSHKVFTFNGGSANSTVIDAMNNKIITTIPLSGKPEFPQTDRKGKIYVNIEDKSQVAVINASTLKVEKTWSVAPGEEPTGLAFDAVNNRLFSGCGNKLLVVSDATNGKVVTTVPIGKGCDGVSFDPENKRIFASNGEGNMSVIKQESSDKYSLMENFPTREGARTIVTDVTTHKIYLPVAEREKGSGTAKPDSFSVLEVEPAQK